MGTRRKILFLIESLAGGGAEKVLTTLVNHIDHKKYDVTICSVVNTGNFRNNIPDNVSYSYIIPNPNSCTSLWSRICYTLKYKLVYKWLPLSIVYRLWVPKGNDTEVAWVEGFATKLLAHSSSNCRKIAWIHCNLQDNHWTSNIYKTPSEEAHCYEAFKLIVGVSASVTNAIKELFGRESDTLTIYNPIDSAEILNLSQQPVNGLQKNDNAIRICSIGRFVSIKAFDRLLRITRQLVIDGHDVKLWLIGDGPLRHEYERYISDNNLQNQVTIWGFQQNPYPYLAASDIFVCSSISEGYSTAVTEALILGKPVITTDCSGMSELLGANEYGLITENDEEALLLGIKSILNDKNLLDNYSRQANKRGKDFCIQHLISPIEAILS